MQDVDAAGRAILLASNLIVSAGCEVLSADLRVTDDLGGDFVGGSVKRAMDAVIHGTCSLALTRELAWGSTLVRPYMVLADASTPSVTRRWNAGVFALTTPKLVTGESPTTWSVDGYDRLYLLDRLVGDSYSIDAGTAYLTAVRQAVTASGISASTVLLDGSASAKTLPQAMTWPLVKPVQQASDAAATSQSDASSTSEASGPATWLRIVNELLAAVGYRSLWADQDGYFRSEPLVAPAARASTWTWPVSGLESIVSEQRTLTRDDWALPNKWIFVRRGMTDATPAEGAGIYTVTDLPGVQRRGLVWPVQVELDAADQAALVTQGDARVAADQQVAASLDLETGPFPCAGHQDVYTVVDPATGGTYRVMGATWTLDLDGGDMAHTWNVL